jgi:hypothetical protein
LNIKRKERKERKERKDRKERKERKRERGRHDVGQNFDLISLVRRRAFPFGRSCNFLTAAQCSDLYIKESKTETEGCEWF